MGTHKVLIGSLDNKYKLKELSWSQSGFIVSKYSEWIWHFDVVLQVFTVTRKFKTLSVFNIYEMYTNTYIGILYYISLSNIHHYIVIHNVCMLYNTLVVSCEDLSYIVIIYYTVGNLTYIIPMKKNYKCFNRSHVFIYW